MLSAALLTRSYTDEFGTFGTLVFGDHSVCSGELSDKNNASEISCIPVGDYQVLWTFSPRFQRHTYELQDVRGRTAIRIHPANWMGERTLGLKCDLDGCIALGLSIGELEGQKALKGSNPAVHLLESFYDTRPFTLQIIAA